MNLELRKIKGIESQGMILMAETRKRELVPATDERWRTAVRSPDPRRSCINLFVRAVASRYFYRFNHLVLL